MSKPVGAVIEIIEVRRAGGEAEVIVPNDVRINGQSLYCSADHPVTVHEIGIDGHDLVQVTLTLIAKRVVVGQEVAE